MNNDLRELEKRMQLHADKAAEQAEARTANAVQQVLRAVLVSLVAEAKVNPSHIGLTLAAQADHPGLEPKARLMIADLAEGMSMLSHFGTRPN